MESVYFHHAKGEWRMEKEEKQTTSSNIKISAELVLVLHSFASELRAGIDCRL